MKKRITSLALSLTLILNTSSIFANVIDTEYIESMANLIKNNYLYEVEDKKLTEGAIKGLFASLDPYSAYYTQEEYKELTQNLTGELDQAGIGVQLTEDQGIITITDIIKNNSAEKAGLKAEDTIVCIDHAEIRDMPLQSIVEKIKGLAGTKVNIGVSRQGTEEILYFDIVREPIIINPVEYRILDGNIGYIKINEFNNNSLIAVKTALHQFDRKKASQVIFDVRDNPGGYLATVNQMLQLLVPKGPLFHTRDSKGKMTTTLSYNEKPAKYKLAVLVNENSASASEIFAAAIKERQAGTIIGRQTFGKGTVQSIVEMKDGGAIKLTVAEYFTPNKNRVNKVGVTPDILIEDIYKEETDIFLEKAIDSLQLK